MHWSAALLLLVGAAITVTSLPGQNAGVIAFADVINALEPDVGGADERQPPVERIAKILRSMLQAEATSKPLVQGRRPRQTILQVSGTDLLASGEEGVVALVVRVHRQLAAPERRVALQCTLLSLPRKLAVAQAVPKVPTAVTEPVAGALIKLAVQAGGAVRNLPECTARPLRTFAMRAGKDVRDQAPVVQGEFVPLDEQEVAVAVKFRGPDAPGSTPPAMLDLTFRLKAGAGVWLMLEPNAKPGDDEQVAVIWLRLATVAPAQDAGKR